MDNIEDVVRSHIAFIYGVSSKGWNTVYCEVCGDGKRTKGPRAGWNFDGDACFYHCFNCGVDANFDPHRDHPLSKNMYNVFEAYGIGSKDYNAVILKDSKVAKKRVKRKRVYLPKTNVPDYFKFLSEFDDNDVLATKARSFLSEKYHITQDDYPFFLSTGKTASSDRGDQYRSKYLRNRIIIPAYHNKRMIYWQARIFIGESDKKYVSASVDNSSGVLFGLDNMFTNMDQPLYITEGFFDSWHVNGIAVITNKMSQPKIDLLSRNNRLKVVIPDYNMDGMNLANQAMELGWGISLPKIFPETDICGAIARYGKLFVVKSIVSNTFHENQAPERLKLFQLDNQRILAKK